VARAQNCALGGGRRFTKAGFVTPLSMAAFCFASGSVSLIPAYLIKFVIFCLTLVRRTFKLNNQPDSRLCLSASCGSCGISRFKLKTWMHEYLLAFHRSVCRLSGRTKSMSFICGSLPFDIKYTEGGQLDSNAGAS